MSKSKVLFEALLASTECPDCEEGKIGSYCGMDESQRHFVHGKRMALYWQNKVKEADKDGTDGGDSVKGDRA